MADSKGIAVGGLRIVCFEDDARPDNLVAFDVDGREVWRADARLGQNRDDTWVDVRIRDDKLEAFTWTCYRVELDQQIGEVLSSLFVK